MELRGNDSTAATHLGFPQKRAPFCNTKSRCNAWLQWWIVGSRGVVRIVEQTDHSEHHYAALDLGSNSFHMIIASEEQGHVRILDRLREAVCLASGLDSENLLTDEAMDRALACITRFAQRLRDFPNRQVRVVGTNTLRKARNADKFLLRARSALGHPIEIIAGREEARLIYLGVVNSHTPPSDNQLVVDIGGGSTEIIIGREEPLERESLHTGCVEQSLRFFEHGKLSQERFDRAVLAARVEVAAIATHFRRTGWSTAVGTSGTIKAIGNIVANQGWSRHGISADSLLELQRSMSDAGHTEMLQFEGLSRDRTPVFAGGVSVLRAVFEELGIESMQVSSGALREGLLHDLIGRTHHEDVRPRTVDAMARRYGADERQSTRIANTAADLLRQSSDAWGLSAVDDGDLLSWAAQLHEIGLSVAHTQYHKHAEYLTSNADMPGFSRQEQAILAFLTRAHRRKFPMKALVNLPEYLIERVVRLALLLRLSVLLHRAREDRELPELRLVVNGERLQLRFPDRWLDMHPLTLALLEEERVYIEKTGYALSFT